MCCVHPAQLQPQQRQAALLVLPLQQLACLQPLSAPVLLHLQLLVVLSQLQLLVALLLHTLLLQLFQLLPLPVQLLQL
jgi:hypothetical protein